MWHQLAEAYLRQLGHVCHMDNGRIPEDDLYSELRSSCSARQGRLRTGHEVHLDQQQTK